MIRQRKSLLNQNLLWYITDQSMTEPLFGSLTLEALGRDTKKKLAAACDRENELVDLGQTLNEDLEENSVPSNSV